VDFDWLLGEEFPATKVKSPGHVVELDGRLGWTSPNTIHNVNFEPKKKKKITPPVIVSKIPALGNSSAKQTISAKQGGRRRKKTRRKTRRKRGGFDPPLANRVIRKKLENHRGALLNLKAVIEKLSSTFVEGINNNQRDIQRIVPAINRHEEAIRLLERLITSLNDKAGEVSRDNVATRLWRMPGGARRRRQRRKTRRKTRRKRRYGPGGETFFSKLIPNLLPPQHLGTVGMWI
jgi:hypothetical protein